MHILSTPFSQLSGDIVTNLQYQIDVLKDSMLSSETKILYGLGPNSTPNDIFQFIHLTMLTNERAVQVTVINSSGTPIKNAYINVTKASGNLSNIKTDENGMYMFAAKADEKITISVPTDIIDLTGTLILTSLTETITSVTLKCEHVNYYSTTSTRNIRISNETKSLDVSMCGGGGGGSSWGTHATSGSGGGGGKTIKEYGVAFSPYETYQLVVGAGGNGSTATGETYIPVSGHAGGTSTAFGLSAIGGSGGYVSGTTCYGGSGNGTGGNGVISYTTGVSADGLPGSNGSETVFSSYDDTMVVGGGGGSGGYLTVYQGNTGYYSSSGGLGGSPAGGSGGNVTFAGTHNPTVSPAMSGSSPGGGGGGAPLNNYGASPGGNGGAGIIALRLHG